MKDTEISSGTRRVELPPRGSRSPRMGWPRSHTRVGPLLDTGYPILASASLRLSSTKWASSLSSPPGPLSPSSRQRVIPVTSTPTVTRHKFRFTNHHQKVLLGVLLVAMASVLWVTTTQLAKSTYQYEDRSFIAPFFVTYFSTAWLVVIYPVFLLGHVISVRGKMSLKATFKENLKVYSDDGLTYRPLKVLAKVVAFSLLWMVTSYVYLRALDMKPCMDVITLFATNSSFVYLLAWILLQKEFMAIRIVAIILAMTGICMVTYMDGGFSSHSMWGAVLAVTSASGAASYKVIFRKLAGEATLGQISLFLSCLSLFSVVTLWPVLLLLYFTKAEPIEWDRVPWSFVCGTAGSALLLNFTLHYGASLTYPVLLQISFMIAIPICAAVDLLWRHETFSPMQVAATVVIISSSLLNLLPVNWHRCLSRVVQFKPRQDPTTATTTSTTTSTTANKATTSAGGAGRKASSAGTIRSKRSRLGSTTTTSTTASFFSPRQTIRSTAC